MGHSDYVSDLSSVSSQLDFGVTKIVANFGAFSALKEDGSVVAWGKSEYGGDSTAVAASLIGVVGFADPFVFDVYTSSGSETSPSEISPSSSAPVFQSATSSTDGSKTS